MAPNDDVAVADDARYNIIEFNHKNIKTIPVFEYDRLHDMKNRIRLLRLFAGPPENPNVECELFEGEFVEGKLIEPRSVEAKDDDGSKDNGKSKTNGKPKADEKSKTDRRLKTDGNGAGLDSSISNASQSGSKDSSEYQPLSSASSQDCDKKNGSETHGGNKPGEGQQGDGKQDGEKQVEEEKDQAKKGEEKPPDTLIKYEALSWRWGENPLHQILIRKGSRLTRKLAHNELVWALKYLRYPNEDRILWIDAICIDQDFIPEKNHQVEMMALIYSCADRVCVWLGIDDRESRLAIKFIKDEVMKLQQFDELCEKKENAVKWQSLLSLMQRSWFSRRWVVQEIALSRKAVIYCGPDDIEWDKFAIAVELFVEVETATHRLSEVMKKDPKYYHVPGWFEYVSELGASLLVQATGTIFRDYKTNQKDTKASERRPLLSLEYLVSSLSAFDVTESRDAIYALLAIAKDSTPFATVEEENQVAIDRTQEALEFFTERKRYIVDYERPYEDVCKDFIEFCINCSDPTRALDILCRPWAPEPKSGKNPVTQKEERPSMPLPSWIPQLSGASFGMFSTPGIRTQKMGRKNADTLVGYPILGQRNYNAAQTRGVDRKALTWRKRLSREPEHSTKAQLPKTSQPPKPPQNPKELRHPDEPQQPREFKKSKAPQQPKGLDPSIGSHYSMYVKGFVLDIVAETTNSSQNGAIPKEWTELAGWKNPLDEETEIPGEFWRTIVADRGKDGRNPPVYYAKACKESVSKGGFLSGAVNTSDLIHNERNSIVAQFCRRVQGVIWNRSLIRTESGSLGLACKDVRKGDFVCILHGCSVPVILRRRDMPKTPWEMEQEEQYDRDQLWFAAMEAGKRRKQRIKELKKKYKRLAADKKKEILEAKEKLDKENENNREKELKKQMSGWLKFQRAKNNSSMTSGDGKTGAGVRGKKMRSKQSYEQLKQMVEGDEKMVENWLNANKVEVKRREVDEAEEESEAEWAKNGTEDTEKPEDPKKTLEDLEKKLKDLKEKLEGIKGRLEVVKTNPGTIKEDMKIEDEDKRWHYTFFGECYIHGMMDGEAMGLFNEDRKFRYQVFELR